MTSIMCRLIPLKHPDRISKQVESERLEIDVSMHFLERDVAQTQPCTRTVTENAMK